MPTLTRDSIKAPDLSKIELPDVEMPDLSKIDLPKFDIGKAAAGAATAVGLRQSRRARWPFVVAAGVAIAAAGWAYMNAAMLRERASQAATWVGDRVGAITGSTVTDESIAFPAAETKPIESEEWTNGSSDYPDGLGNSTSDMAGTSGDETPAWETTATSRT